ncbi:MAG: hypothetical protein ACM3ST_11115, partial [Bdellovibrio bacteriovorus]
MSSTAHSPASAPDSASAHQVALHWLLGALLVLAPLFRSGQPALAVLMLELLAVAVLVLVLWQPGRTRVTRWEGLAIGLLLAVPLLYLTPMPSALATWLPGREPYLAARSLLGTEGSA